MSRLFIIGNGYDLDRRHNDTSYNEFKKWVRGYYLDDGPEKLVFINKKGDIEYRSCRNLNPIPGEMFENLFINLGDNDKRQLKTNDEMMKRFTAAVLYKSMEELHDPEWHNFEENLSKVPIKKMINDFKKVNSLDDVKLEPLFGSSVDRETDILTSTPKWTWVLFCEWIGSLVNKKINICKKGFEKEIIKNIRPDDIFIIFNYTETIENLFKLNSSSIFYHVHGKYKVNKSIVVGHNNKKYRKPPKSYDKEKEYIEQFFTDLYKSPEKVINTNKELWERISNINSLDIYEFGWSCSQVDEDYIKHIISLRTNKETILHLNDFKGAGAEKAKQWIKYGFNKNNIYLYEENGDKITEKEYKMFLDE